MPNPLPRTTCREPLVRPGGSRQGGRTTEGPGRKPVGVYLTSCLFVESFGLSEWANGDHQKKADHQQGDMHV